MAGAGQAKLSLAEIEAYRGQGSGKVSGGKLRYFCPIHGGDNQRSLQVNPANGHYKCFACGAWGYLKELAKEGSGSWKTQEPIQRLTRRLYQKKEERKTPAIREDLLAWLQAFQKRLPGSIGEKYLSSRGISLEVAQKYGVGYEPSGKTKSGEPRKSIFGEKARWQWGRVIFPHTNLKGHVVNLYGRAVVSDIWANTEKKKQYLKWIKHRHLTGDKGVFNAKALFEDTVFITEGVFDCLPLTMAGYNACAIFGIDGLRWEWVRSRRVVFCFDNDETGREKWKDLAGQGVLLDKEVYFLPQEVYCGYKDLNELWIAKRTIDIGQWEEKRPLPVITVKEEPITEAENVSLGMAEKTPPIDSQEETKEDLPQKSYSLSVEPRTTGKKPRSLLCPKCGATDQFSFRKEGKGGAGGDGKTQGGEEHIFCDICHSKLIPGKHFADTIEHLKEQFEIQGGEKEEPGARGEESQDEFDESWENFDIRNFK